MSRELNDIVEEYRIRMGVDSLHVDYGPECSPKLLEEFLETMMTNMRELETYPEELVLRGKIDQLEKRLRRVADHCKIDVKELYSEGRQDKWYWSLRKKVFAEVDIISYNETELLEFCREHSK